MKTEEYIREIELKEVLFKILHEWRKLIFVGIIFTVLLGSYKYNHGNQQLNNPDMIKSQEQSYKNSFSTYETSKTLLEKDISNINTSIDRQKDYNEKSLLMQINPFDEKVGTVSFYIKTDYKINPNLTYQNVDISKMLVQSYFTLAINGDLYNYILENLSTKTELRYLKEIITVNVDYDTNMINIQAINNDKDLCNEIINLSMECFQNAQANFNKVIGKHSLNIIDNAIQTIVDFNVDNIQKTNKQTLIDLENNLVTKQNTLNELKVPVKTLITKKSVIKSSILYGIVGMMAGIFLEMVIIFIIFIMSDKCYNSKELRKRYHLKVLGIIKNNNIRIFGFIDKWINSIEGVSNNKLQDKDAVKRICANLKALLKVEGSVKNIMITGTIRQEKLENICKNLQEELNDEAYKFICGSNISYTAETITNITDCAAVVIVEEIGKSTFTEITKELEYINDLDKEVMGVILV